VTASDLLICYYGDDFTGSTDAMESLARAGVRTALFIDPPGPDRLARYPGLRAVGVAGLTRSMTPGDIERELRPALARLKALGAPVVHYKVCSTFDSSPQVGSIGRVIDLAAGVFDAPFVPLLVGAPALGRYCVFGNLFARFGRDSEPYRLDRHPSMSRHPITPADESDLRLHLGRQTSKRIELFDVLSVALAPEAARAALEQLLARKPDVVLFDVLYESQLEGIGQLIDGYASRQRPLFVVGSSGVEMALGAHWAARGRISPPAAFPDPRPVEPLLVASGSCSPVTEGQIARALANGFDEVPLDTAALAADDGAARDELRRASDAVVAYLAAGRHVIVHTSRGGQDPRVAATARVLRDRGLDEMSGKTLTARLFGDALGQVVLASVARAGVRRLLVAGGDTSGYLARALGIEALEMIAPLTPGAPLCRARAPGSPADGLEVNFKGGQVGSPDYFAAVARGGAG
jgi:uncharacterized protein YgbK (DUF1537 family)